MLDALFVPGGDFTRDKKSPLVSGGVINRDKRPAQPFVPVGGSNRDQRVPFYPGEDLQPGQIASPRTSSHPSILFNSHPPLSYLISSSPSPRGFPSLSILKLPASHPSPPSRRGWPGAAALRLGTQVAVAWGGAAAHRPARRPPWLARRRRPPPSAQAAVVGQAPPPSARARRPPWPGQAPPPSVRRAGRHNAAATFAGPFQVSTNSMRSRIKINFFLLQPHLLLHKLNFISAEQVLRDVRGTVHQEGPDAQVPAAGRRVAAGLRPGGCVSWPAGSSSSARPRWTRGQVRPQRIQAVRSYRLDEFVFVNDLCL